MSIKSRWLVAVLSAGNLNASTCPCCILKKATTINKMADKKKKKENITEAEEQK